MCLILFAYRAHADYPLVLIANRDEYYARPTRDAHWWEDAEVFAGRDLEAGGTWIGVNRAGRLAAVTNVREPGSMRSGKRSRGDLTREYLIGKDSAHEYLQRIDEQADDFAGFNLLLSDDEGLCFYSNREHEIRERDTLPPPFRVFRVFRGCPFSSRICACSGPFFPGIPLISVDMKTTNN